MPRQPLTIVKDSFSKTELPSFGADDVVAFETLVARIRSGKIVADCLSRPSVRLRTERLDTLTFPLVTALICRFISRGSVQFCDNHGNREPVSLVRLARMGCAFVRDKLASGALLERTARLARSFDGAYRPGLAFDPAKRPVYMRTDLLFGTRCGGSVGHIAGVLNNLDAFTAAPLFATTERTPTVREDIESLTILPDHRFRDFIELPYFHFSAPFADAVHAHLAPGEAGVVYQRMSVGNLSGLMLARRRGIPFVLEFNGSEVWAARNWGMPLRHERLAREIELANLRCADLVVVVSRPIRDELAQLGIDPERILVNPNGVDARRYSPDADGKAVRKRYGIDDKLVIGFIGTFGRWHGAEVLAQAFAALRGSRPDLRDNMKLLLIGDGMTMPEVKDILARTGADADTVFTGIVPQADGPAHLAACDILASPHVPNPDGTPFFGSPTKLFEYMATGKGIVASDLEQIGETLEHMDTAWMVRPGDPEDLARGLAALADDPALRASLGENARRRAVERHTWKRHTQRIIERLEELCPRT